MCYHGIMPTNPRRPRDPNELAFQVFQEAIGEASPPPPEREKNAAAVALGKLGGAKGEEGPGREDDSRGAGGERAVETTSVLDLLDIQGQPCYNCPIGIITIAFIRLRDHKPMKP